jgi:galactonate dehydratase
MSDGERLRLKGEFAESEGNVAELILGRHSHSEAVEGALKALSKWFIGWPTDNINDIFEHAYRGKFYRGGEVLMSALSGLDIALWDLKGKRLGVPVWSLLGGLTRDKVKVYCWIGGDRPGDVLEQAKIRKEKGFTAVKVRSFLHVPNAKADIPAS